MSLHNIRSTKHFYDVTFKIVSIDLDDAEKTDDLSVGLRFAEKCVTINSGDEKVEIDSKMKTKTVKKIQKEMFNDEVTTDDEERERHEAKGGHKKGETSDEDWNIKEGLEKDPNSRKRVERIYKSLDDYSPIDGDDEASQMSNNLQASKRAVRARSLSSRRRAALASVAAMKSSKLQDIETFSIDSEKLPKLEALAKLESPAKLETSAKLQSAGKRKNRTSDKKEKLKNLQNIFGSVTERYKASPVCMSEKLAKHCIKYEVCRGSNLIGEFKPSSFICETSP